MNETVDHKAREWIRELEHGMAEMQKQQAVTAQILQGVVQEQERFRQRMTEDEKLTRKLEAGVEVSRSRLAMIGLGVMVVAGIVGNLVVSWFTR